MVTHYKYEQHNFSEQNLEIIFLICHKEKRHILIIHYNWKKKSKPEQLTYKICAYIAELHKTAAESIHAQMQTPSIFYFLVYDRQAI